MDTVWLPSPTLPERWEISSKGQIRNKNTKRRVKTQINKGGYEVVATKVGGRHGKDVLIRVHREVATAFISNPDNKPHVNHLDGVKHHNNASNLAWCTPHENMRHAEDNGLLKDGQKKQSGTKNKRAVLSKQQVSWVRKMHIPRCRKRGARALARKLGVSHNTVWAVANGRRYEYD